jgi:type II secretory pathway component PulK
MKGYWILAIMASTQFAPAKSPAVSEPDAGLLAAVDVQSANVIEGFVTGDFEQWYPGFYSGFWWARETTEMASNGLFRVNYVIFNRHDKAVNELSVLRYRPGATTANPVSHSRREASGPEHDFKHPRHRRSAAALAVEKIEEMLISTQYFPDNLRYQFSGGSQVVSFVARLPDSILSRDTFPYLPQRRVSFHLRAGRRKLPELIMEQAPLLFDLAQIEPNRVRLTDDVSLFALEYWDWTAGAWLDQWPLTNPLPRMVRVTVGLGKAHHGSNAPRELSSRIVALPVEAAFGPPTNSPSRPATPLEPDNLHEGAQPPPNEGIAVIAWERQASLPEIQSQERAVASRVELQWLGRSGVELAKHIIASEPIGPSGPVDSLNSRWAVPLNDYPLGNASLSIRIVDLDRKFDINVADESILRQALILTGIDPPAHPVILDSILDWRDVDDLVRPQGAESTVYLDLEPPYFAKDGPIDDLSELLLVRGVTPPMYFGEQVGTLPAGPSDALGFVDLFAALSSRVLNINTASLATLQLLPPIDENVAQAIIQRRAGPDGFDATEDDTPFRNPGEIANIPGLPPPVIQQIGRFLTTRSVVFEVRVRVRLGQETRGFAAILQRSSPLEVQILAFYWE